MTVVGYLSTQTVQDAVDAVWIQYRYDSPDTAGSEWDRETDYLLPTAGALHPAGGTPLTSFVSRWFGSHVVPEGATYARLRANVYAQRISADDELFTPITIRKGVWGTGTPLFGDFADTWYTQSIPAYHGPPAPVDWVAYPIDVLIPTFGVGLCQFVIENVIDLGWSHPGTPEQHAVYLRAPGAVVSPGETAKYNLDFYSGIAGITQPCECLPWTDGTPTANQPIGPEPVGVGDGITEAFTTAWPYNASSLSVTIDGILVPADQTNPATGLFTLSFAPEIGETVLAKYRYQEPP